MKAKLSLTIEDSLLLQVRKYAASAKMSISQMVEDYLRNITAPAAEKENIIDLVEKLDSPSFEKNIDWKKSYHEEQIGKDSV